MTTGYAFLPVISDADAAHLPGLIDWYESGMAPSPSEEIRRMVTKIATLYPSAKISDQEAEMRMELYTELLADIPFDCLSAGFKAVAKSSRFFPSVAEIRERAEPMMYERRAKINGMRNLLRKHEKEWQSDAGDDVCTPEEAAAIIKKFGIGLRSVGIDEMERNARPAAPVDVVEGGGE